MFNIYDVSTYYRRNKYAFRFGKRFLCTRWREVLASEEGVRSPLLEQANHID